MDLKQEHTANLEFALKSQINLMVGFVCLFVLQSAVQ